MAWDAVAEGEYMEGLSNNRRQLGKEFNKN